MKFKTILLLLALCVAAGVSAQTSEDVVDRVSRAVGVRLPDGYEAPVKAYVQGSKVLEGDEAIFTEQFITQQMKEDWGINKQNQLLFIWDAIYEQITKKNFYDGEDGNNQRLKDFEKTMDNIEACGKKYKQDIIAYMKQQSAEAQQRSAEATKAGVSQITRYYNLCKNYPNAVVKEELEETKKYAKRVIENCKQYNIDYKAVLRKELGNDKKVEELLKFYGVE